jgi:hypothetical protein
MHVLKIIENRIVDLGSFTRPGKYAPKYFIDMLVSGGLIHNFSQTEVLVIKALYLGAIEAVLFSGNGEEMRFLWKVAEFLNLYFAKAKEIAKEISDNPDMFEELKALRHI